MKRIRPHHVISFLTIGGFLFAVLNFNPQFGEPLFSSLEQFVLVAEDKIHLAKDVQISSGDLVANEEITITENNIINGNLFSDDIKIAENTQINGNVSFNKLKLAQNSQILGTTSSPISLPIIKLPDIPPFETGAQKLKIDQDQTLDPGNFDEIEAKQNISLTLNPGTYNLNKLELRTNSKLLFSGKITINIKEELKINEKVLIAPTQNLSPTDLEINFAGEKPITVGEESFISAKFLAPNSKVNLGERTTLRGQILAKEIKVGEDSLLSRELSISRGSDPDKIVTAPTGDQFIVNEILILLTPEATLVDAQNISNSINGRITAFVDSINLYRIEVQTTTIEELNNLLTQLRNSNNPKIRVVNTNNLLEIF